MASFGEKAAIVFQGKSTPFDLRQIHLSPRWRVFTQLSLTFLFLLLVLDIYRNGRLYINENVFFTEAVSNAPATHKDFPKYSLWPMIVLNVLAIIPGVYVFLYLRYNFLE